LAKLAICHFDRTLYTAIFLTAAALKTVVASNGAMRDMLRSGNSEDDRLAGEILKVNLTTACQLVLEACERQTILNQLQQQCRQAKSPLIDADYREATRAIGRFFYNMPNKHDEAATIMLACMSMSGKTDLASPEYNLRIVQELKPRLEYAGYKVEVPDMQKHYGPITVTPPGESEHKR